LKLFHRQAKPFRNVVECLPQTVHATSGQIDETTASRIHRRTSQRLSHPFAVLNNQSLDGGNGTSSRLFAKFAILKNGCGRCPSEPFRLYASLWNEGGQRDIMRKTTISKKPHQKTTFVVFLTGEENHNVVFWMEQENHIVVIRTFVV